jgi:hypothetical protein
MKYLIVSALLVFGCGSNGNGKSNTTGGGTACKGAISGQEVGDVTCEEVTWVLDSNTMQAVIGLQGEQDTLKSGVMFSCPIYGLSGPPQNGVWDYNTLGSFACTVTDGNDLWVASLGMNSRTLGSASVHVTSYTLETVGQWTLHGHLDAAAAATPGNGSTGEVDLNLDF